jgi:hypothetical protein
LPPVRRTASRFDKIAGGQIIEHATERLFGDGQNPQQIADRQVRLARDKIKRAVVRASKAMFGQPLVNRTGEPGISEKQQFDAAADLMLAKKQG